MSEIIPAGVPDIDPDEPVVVFVMLECRTCGEHSDWIRKEDNDAYHSWDVDHQGTTGHGKFYLWSITRNTAQVFRM